MPRVLIVDDDPDIRMMLSIALKQIARVEVVGSAEDGQEGVEKALELDPDFILMDVMMPRMDGVEATRQLKDAKSKSTVIGFTATSEEAVDEMLRAGAVAVIQKTHLSDLLSKLQQLAS
jgi:CheY-like chemotaxis protein